MDSQFGIELNANLIISSKLFYGLKFIYIVEHYRVLGILKNVHTLNDLST